MRCMELKETKDENPDQLLCPCAIAYLKIVSAGVVNFFKKPETVEIVIRPVHLNLAQLASSCYIVLSSFSGSSNVFSV